MGRKSTIATLPTEVKEYLNKLLRDNATQLQATDLVNQQLTELGLEAVSKSAVNRYAIKMAEVGKKIQQSREVSEMWIAKLGSTPAGKTGHLLNEIIRTLAFEMTTNLDEEKVTPELLSDLALAVQRLERASAESERRERQIKQQVQKEALNKVEQSAKTKGVSQLTIAQIREAMQ